ncbi:MAG TPA: HAMP domain-containing sensor histidine kinase [Acidimicrobiales bacterium]
MSAQGVRWWQRLDVRLFASYAAVTVAGAVVLLVTVRLLVPPLFDRRMGSGPRAGRGPGHDAHDALTGALDRALVVALVASLVAAVIVAVLVARAILGPVGRVRTATRRLAAGHYGERVPEPAEPELAALAADVNALARSLDDTERRRTQLVSDVAHELRTPLTTIRGYAEGLADGVVAPDADVLGAVLGEVDRLERLAGDLSSLSRADEGAPGLHLAPVDLAALTAGVVERFRARAAEAGVDIAVTGADRLPVTADADRLDQVIANLVANAVTYTPAGGRVVVDVAAAEGAGTVRVSDSGIGLAADELERVFDRFYRIEGVSRPPGGSGIGLAIARTYARAHGGEVTASSEGPGRGATFVLRVPAAGPG